jgi:hypothetical protein
MLMKIIGTLAILAAAPFALTALALPTKGFHYSAPKASSYRAPSYPSYSAPSLHSGYTTRRGTYVAPHYQTAPNQTKVDNWSSKPNVNPTTGKEGTKDPFAPGH